MLEETGLIVEPAEILGAYGGSEFRHIYPNGDTVEYVVTLYRCDIVEQTARRLDSETLGLRYFSEAQMPTLVLPYPRSVLFGGHRSVSGVTQSRRAEIANDTEKGSIGPKT
jgi:hypothetical protein